MKQLFFELLQVSLGTRDRLSRVPSAVEWGKEFAEAQRQSVVGLLLEGVERLSSLTTNPFQKDEGDFGAFTVNLPKPLLLRWIGLVQINEAIYLRHCQRAAELTRQMRSVGFHTCILKGLSAAARYPKPERRACGDIDIWAMPVHGSLSMVHGFRKSLMLWLRSEYKVEHVEWHHIGTRVFPDVAVEVHVHPSWLFNPFRNSCLQRFFNDNTNEHKLYVSNELEFNVTSATFDAVYQLTHCFHHVLEEGLGMRHVVDYYYVLLQLHTESTDSSLGHQLSIKYPVRQTLTLLGLMTFAGAMMYVLREACAMPEEWMLCEPDEKEGKWLLQEIMAGGNFGQTRTDGKVRNSFSRWWMMVRHYPGEVLWMVPWKVWHWGWRKVNKR